LCRRKTKLDRSTRELQLPSFAGGLRLGFLGLLNQDAAKFIDPPGEVQGVFLQYLHRAAVVTLVFQFGDTLVEGRAAPFPAFGSRVGSEIFEPEVSQR
jgi:hypothetical protein